MTTTLDRLGRGARAVVRQIRAARSIRHRLGGLGLHPGDVLEVVRGSWRSGPILIAIHGVEVALARGQAEVVEVELADPS
jgi:Fe2+ transport system protein FeoA